MAQGIPDYVVKVTASLFDAGLADPRGGEYREIELQGALKTHGWVFGNFAVGWNGLVYSVLSVGAPADLEKDVRTIAGTEPWSGRLALRRDAPPVQTAFWSKMQSVQTIAPLSIALLLRLDRPDFAALLWRAPETSDFGGRLAKREADEVRWLSTALRSWLATAFWRMTGARDRDDDREASDVGESIILWEPRAKALWKQIPAALPAQFTSASFLWPVPMLLDDSQRRLREPVRPKVDFRALAERLRKDPATSSEFLQKPQAERIAELIDRLEDVRGDKIGWPGPLLYSFDPIYELLIREGEAAIAPLLNAAEHDRRLTRTMDYSRPWSIERAPIPVRDVANLIIRGILELPSRVERSTPAELRAWWGTHKSNDRLGRSFELLADDKATPEEWVQSADSITLRSDIQRSGESTQIGKDACKPETPIPDAHGESLRERHNPSVSELLAKRTAALAALQKPASACRMAFMAYLWEPKMSLTALQAAANLDACRGDRLVTAARMSLGDSQAGVDWAERIEKRVSDPAFRITELLPMWMFPADPAMEHAAERLFARPESPLSPGVQFLGINSPLLTVPIYRRALRAALNDNTNAGSATRSPEGMLSIAIKNGGWGSSKPGHDPRQVPPGEERPVRVKDMAAWQLSLVDEAPEFQPDWPEKDKDAAIANIADFLTIQERELRAFPVRLQDTACLRELVYLHK
jgi:hypothetical protein